MSAPLASVPSSAVGSRGAALKPHQRALVGMVVVVLAALALVLWRGALQPFLSRPVHRLLHILGAVLFLGNVVAGALWLGFADASGSRAALRFATRMINVADLVITGPAALLLFLNGAALVPAWGGLSLQPWLARSVALFTVLTLLWASVLVPLQLHLENRIALLVDGPFPPTLRRRLIAYFVAGGAAGLLALSILGLMVLR